AGHRHDDESETEMMLDLAIVIVNYNVCDLLRRCVQSVYASEGVRFAVCVVDNCSNDASGGMVEPECPQEQLSANKEHGGYPWANHQGLSCVGTAGEGAARYSLLLNPDPEVPPQAFATLVRYMDEHPEVGVVGPKLVLLDGSLDLACRRGFDSMSALVYR